MVQIIGRIYKIVSSECDGCYIGSTTQQLSRRLCVHKSHYKRYLAGKCNYMTSFDVIKFADASIELVHEGVFDSKNDLEHLEGEIIQTTPNVVNKNIAGWTGTKQEYDKQYYQDNREALLAHMNTKCVCPTCGGKYTIVNKQKHCRTTKHQNAVSSASSVIDSSETSTDLP
jgi:hypothetical protein